MPQQNKTGLPGLQQQQLLPAATSDFFFRPLLSGGPKDHVHFAIFTTFHWIIATSIRQAPIYSGEL